MKFLKSFGLFLLALLSVITILMLIMPTKQHLERSIVISAPASTVYDYLSKLENFNKWSVWTQSDSTIKNTITGNDGTLGAYNTWIGDPEISGEGKMEITTLDINKKVEHQITFIKPKPIAAKSKFELIEVNGQTKVTWEFDIATPRPSNIFNLFGSIDKKMGKDFEDGLKNLKTAIGSTKPKVKAKTYEVSQINFPATTYAQVRQLISQNDIPSFYSQHIQILFDETSKIEVSVTGSPTGLFYTWDELNHQTDMAAALPVDKGTKIDNSIIQVVDLPASKAISVDYYGAYDKATDAYTSLTQYLETNNLKQKAPAIQQYLSDPKLVTDTAKWHTRIIFLIE